MGEYTEECINTFLMNQGQLFDEPVAENYDEAEAFLEDCLAVVADNLDDVRAYMEEEGMDVEEMSDAELEEQSEVFALPDGQYLIVMGLKNERKLKRMKYDVIIIGAGPSGIFCAYELLKEKPDLKVLMIEKGRSIESRQCPKRKTKKCVNCKPCSITTGFAGAGAFSDGKLSLSPDVGGNLPEILGYEKTVELIHESDQIYLDFGADKNVYGVDKEKEIREIRRRAINANLKLIECPIRHLGTEEGYKIYSRLEDHLKEIGVEMKFNTMVNDITIEDGRATAVTLEDGTVYEADEIVSAVGREGADWFSHICNGHGIETEVGTVDIGVRVEVRDEVMEFLNKNLYEAKLVYYTPTFDDKVRTFCTNPSGEVATEYYENGLAVVNGHAYKSQEINSFKVILR